MGPSGDVMDFSCQVLAMAWKVKRTLAVRMELADLYQAGWLGLLNAWERFDPVRKVPFAVYAAFRIRGAMLDSLRQQDYLSRKARRRSRRIQAAAQRLSQAAGASPSDEEVAEASGESLETVRRLRHVQHLSSDLVALSDQSVEPPERAVYVAELMQLVQRAHLPLRQARVLQLHYWNDLPLKRVGSVLGVSESRASQIHAAAIQHLRKILKSSGAAACEGEANRPSVCEF